jgi:hypothetical protein
MNPGEPFRRMNLWRAFRGMDASCMESLERIGSMESLKRNESKKRESGEE